MSDTPAARRRDPEGRRRAILAAAEQIVVEQGLGALTHRAAAARAGVAVGSTTQLFSSIEDLRACALTSLADGIEAELREVEERVAALDVVDAETVAVLSAEAMHEFFLEPAAVRATVALLGAGTTDPRLRELAARWTDRFAELLGEHVGPGPALAVAVYLDGVSVHAALHDRPVDPAAIATAVRALLGATS